MKLVLLQGEINTNNPTKGREDSSEEMGPGGNWREGAPGRAPQAEKDEAVWTNQKGQCCWNPGYVGE